MVSLHIKKQARDLFHKHRVINCPAFPSENIRLNAKGLNHLFYKGSRSGRDINQICVRVGLLERAVTILSTMPYFQEEREVAVDGVAIKYWSFEAVIDEKRLKVIVRQVGKGGKHLWSVIPSWKKVNGKRINATGVFENY